MAHTKAGGSTKLGRDSAGQRLGVKLFGGQMAQGGDIVVRQRGTRMVPGEGVAVGKDHTIFATRPGAVSFSTRKVAKFTGQKVRRTVVSVTSV
ncbi:50S ribosomal protein L27 [Candidatus Parcubacteria bacterium]|nr:50S ribosomal protein L27 [Candidatus Parcubacteria bacterium]